MNIADLFTDLKVVEFASALAGPSVGMFFAECGATVTKIENSTTGGDVTRRWKHPNEEVDHPFSAYYHSTNWHKEVVMLDLSRDDDHQRMLSILKDADIILANFKPGSASRYGLDYDRIARTYPKMIYGQISAYGAQDPRPGFDALLQAESGWMSINGPEGSQGMKVGLPIIDILAGHQLKEGILAALYLRTQTGRGSHVHVSLFDAAISALSFQASTYLNLGIIPTPYGSQHPNIAPYGDIVMTNDGTSYLLAVGSDRQFGALSTLLKHPEWSSDARFINNATRVFNREELTILIQSMVGDLVSRDFEVLCQQYKVPCGRIKLMDEVFDEDTRSRLLLDQVDQDEISYRVRTAVFDIKHFSH